MLEGAKSIGAGAATIASAGAAIGIGNVFSSFIHSMSMAATVSSVVTLTLAVLAFSFFSFRLKGKGPLKRVIYLLLLFSVGFVGSLIRIKVVYLLGGQALLLLEPLLWYGVGGGVPGGASSSSEMFTYTSDLEDSASSGRSSSVNQPIQREQAGPSNAAPQPAAPPANPAPFGGDEAGPSVPRRDEIVGGDSVEAIERRLLAKSRYPSYEDIQLAHIDAEDLFEVKVNIVKKMAVLDPTGDWMGRGARALDNPRTATGEHSLEHLYHLLSALNERGKEAPEFEELKNRVFLKKGGPGPGGGSIA